MKCLITGASGLLGRAIADRLASGHEVVGCSFSQRSDAWTPVDLRDAGAVQALVSRVKPACVIHSAAARNPDWCEDHPDEATALNVEGTRHVADGAAEVGAKLVYISTDYVFDGRAGPYDETRQPAPINHYGRTKLEGERIAAGLPGSLILRISMLYGPGARPEEDHLRNLVKRMRSADRVPIDHVARRTPTFTLDVADTIAFLIDRDHTGIIHVTSGETVTRYEMALVVGELLGLATDHVEPGPAGKARAPRPADARLDGGRLAGLGFGPFRTFREGVSWMIHEGGWRADA